MGTDGTPRSQSGDVQHAADLDTPTERRGARHRTEATADFPVNRIGTPPFAA